MNKKCQVFTPDEIASILLDSVGYKGFLYGKKILENSCGDGQILKFIVERYIVGCLKAGIPIKKIKSGLEQDIYGLEIDNVICNQCIYNMNRVASKFEIYNVRWQILNKDALRINYPNKFDYCIGNPPYIRYQDLDSRTRFFVKNNFQVCKSGKFDYSYAFIESAINCLSKTGKLGYLIPSSIFKNVFAENLRIILRPGLEKIIDFKERQLFIGKLVASSIIIYSNADSDSFLYCNNEAKSSLVMPKSKLIGKWTFGCLAKKNKNMVRFGDLWQASVSIATLLNKAFILNDYEDTGNYVRVGRCWKIEKDITKKSVSPRSLHYNKKLLIIFPYSYKNNCITRYSETEFKHKFPYASKYLEQFLDKLTQRNADVTAKWYEYGRSQALAHINQRKILISTIITNRINANILSKNVIPYSGIYIIQKGKKGLDLAKKILESARFMEYIENVGIQVNGNSIRISPKDVNDYMFLEDDIE
jgi:hypothetical protein